MWEKYYFTFVFFIYTGKSTQAEIFRQYYRMFTWQSAELTDATKTKLLPENKGYFLQLSKKVINNSSDISTMNHAMNDDNAYEYDEFIELMEGNITSDAIDFGSIVLDFWTPAIPKHDGILNPYWQRLADALNQRANPNPIIFCVNNVELPEVVLDMLLTALKTQNINNLVFQNGGIGCDGILLIANLLTANMALTALSLRKNSLEDLFAVTKLANSRSFTF